MREIKFRLVKNGKIVGYEKIAPDGDGNLHSAWNTNNIGGWILTDLPVHDSKDQSTNLHDKNGKEIYGADIVKEDSIPVPMEVTWFDSAWWTESSDGQWGDRIAEFSSSSIEIIGNIYQNPEFTRCTPGEGLIFNWH